MVLWFVLCGIGKFKAAIFRLFPPKSYSMPEGNLRKQSVLQQDGDYYSNVSNKKR